MKATPASGSTPPPILTAHVFPPKASRRAPILVSRLITALVQAQRIADELLTEDMTAAEAEFHLNGAALLVSMLRDDIEDRIHGAECHTPSQLAEDVALLRIKAGIEPEALELAA